MPTKLANRVKVSVASAPGTNVSVTLGTPLAGFQSFSDAGITDGQTVRYLLEDSDEFEIGSGVYTSSGTTLSRTTVLESSNSGNRIDASALTHVIVTVAADDIVVADGGTFTGNVDFSDGVDVSGTSTLNGTLTSSGTIANDASSTTTYASGATATFNNNPSFSSYVDYTAIAHPSHQEGRVFYDNVHKTLNYYSDVSNVTHEIGIEEHQRVYNNTGSTILKGQPLYFSGNHILGSYKIPTVGLADATDVNAYNAQGLAAADIANGAEGYCIIAGQIFGVDTSGLNAGTNFFVGLTPGAVQNASPTYPNFPMCLGWVVSSDATEGVLLVNQQNHSVNSFRVRTSAHVGTDLQVDGDLTVLGTTTSVSTADVTAGAPFYRANEGDSIGEAGTTFVGTGLDDAFFAGHFTGTTNTTYYVKIDSVGTPDTFAVSLDDFVTTISTGTPITGSPQLIHSADNISVEFGATTGHTLNDKWEGTAGPTNVDTGFFSNRNTGTTGVGYTHVGMYFDVTDAKWKFLDEYDPVPQGSIDPTDASYNLGTIVAGTFEGALSGNVTGNVTGDLSGSVTLGSADSLVFEGATEDAFETTLAVTDPTADRTATLPDATGTILVQNPSSGLVTTGTSTGQILFQGSNPNFKLVDTDSDASQFQIFNDFGGDDVYFLCVDQNQQAANSSLRIRIDNEEIGEFTTSGFQFFANNNLRFEGATDDAFETTVTVVDPTADQTITLPDQTGTVLLTDLTEETKTVEIKTSETSALKIGTSTIPSMLEFDTSDPGVNVKGADFLHETSVSDVFRLKNTGNSASGPFVQMHNTRAGAVGVVDDSLGQIRYRGNSTTQTNGDVNYAEIDCNIVDPTNGSLASKIDFTVRTNNLFTNTVRINGANDGVSNATLTILDGTDLLFNTGTYDVRVSAETATADRTLTVPDEDGILTTRRRAIAYAMIFGG